MPDFIKPKLTGGTFFTLLLKACKPRCSKQENLDGRSDKLSECQVLQSLLEIYNKDISYPGKGTAKSDCTKFKSCKINDSSWIYINDRNGIVAFNNEFKHQYSAVLGRTQKMFDDFIDIGNENKIKKLGRSILELIKNDETISEDAEFYILENEKALLKKDIIPSLKYSIQPVILGVWHYIITLKVNNESGRETYMQWHEKKGNKYKFISNIGEDEFINTEITIYTPIEANENPSVPDSTPAVNADTALNRMLKKYEKYFKRAVKDLTDVKTILYKGDSVAFYDIFVAPDISNRRTIKSKDELKELKGNLLFTKKYIETFGRFTSITAPGGFGKSMFMKHLFMNETVKELPKKYKTGLIPILLQIRSFTKNDATLKKMLHNSVNSYIDIEYDDFLNDLDEGGFLLLFDGLDEIKSSELDSFFIQLNELTTKYPNNYFVTSSRPSEQMESLSKFKVLLLNGLEVDRAQKLIHKLPKYDESVKNNFCELLENKAYKRYSYIASNPLLLSLMFLVYVNYQKLPTKTYQFYEKAFDILYKEHDEIKGYTSRKFATNLKKTNFKILLSEFCYHATSNQDYDYSDMMIAKILKKTSFSAIDPDDFITDLSNNLNLFFKEDGKYRFVHRSFQEYFCAKYISELDDAEFVRLPEWIENLSKVKQSMYFHNRGFGEFSFLFEIDKERTVKLVVKPFLNSLIKGPMSTELLNFALNVYKYLDYGFETAMIPTNKFASLLMDYAGIDEFCEINDLKLPVFEEYIAGRYYMVPEWSEDGLVGYDKWSDDDLKDYLKRYPEETMESLTTSFKIKIGDYDVFEYSIPIIDLEKNHEKFSKVIELISSEDSTLYDKYKKLYVIK